MSDSEDTRFLQLIETAVHDDSLVQLVLHRSRQPGNQTQKIIIRLVRLREGLRLSFVSQRGTRSLTENLDPVEALKFVGTLLANEFAAASLFTTTETIERFTDATGQIHMRKGPPCRFGGKAIREHDREKRRLISPKTAWLARLGVTAENGSVRPSMGAKFRQIQRFVELLDHLLPETRIPDNAPLKIVDMGCGKGYLTFATYHYLRQRRSAPIEVVGIEKRADLADAANRVAEECSATGLRFEAGTIETWVTRPVDVLIALHACNTATDEAIAHGIEAKARIILVAPCCHHELSAQLQPHGVFGRLARHGVLRERQAEFATDALRALLLEWSGYVVKVIEFVSPEHTAKNLMIAAIRRDQRDHQPPDVGDQIVQLAEAYGIRSQALASKLGFGLERVREVPQETE